MFTLISEVPRRALQNALESQQRVDGKERDESIKGLLLKEEAAALVPHSQTAELLTPGRIGPRL